MTTSGEVLEFQAEAKELLSLVIHSLYTSKDIFLRELISNASDALDRLRFESLTHQDLLTGDERFEIRLAVDPVARTLTVSDTGIGMTRDEVISNVGTIARSGTRHLRQQLAHNGSAVDAAQLIGQFGVGFYSAFMVAERVTLLTRRAGEDLATVWESDGQGTFTVKESERFEHGTSVTLYLKTPDPESGIEDYTDAWWLSDAVRKHSNFIRYPIITTDTIQESSAKGTAQSVREDRVLNSMKAIWKRPPAEVKHEEHVEFYRELAHDWGEPLRSVHFKTEGTFEYDALLYIPSHAPADLYYVHPSVGLKLFANCVLIMAECRELLPVYLRFIRGVVDVSDLPLNISRQRLQQDHHISTIRRRLTRKVLDTLQLLFEQDRDQYVSLWREFGRAIKEGISEDFDNRERILSLALFQSSKEPEREITLADYVGRMKPDQEHIFYLTGESRRLLEYSPHLEALRSKSYEVLFMTEPVDELLLQNVTEFQGKKLKSAGKGSIQLGTADEKGAAAGLLAEQEVEYKTLMDFLRQSLDAHVKQVRLSSRLTKSPVCLVVGDHDESPLLERVLLRGKGGGSQQRRVLELNPAHPLIARMSHRLVEDPHDVTVDRAAKLLFGLALMLEGSELPDPVGFQQTALDVLNQLV